MEKRDKIIIVGLIIVVIALVGCIAYMFASNNLVKEDVKLEIKGNATIEEGGKITVQLSNLNGGALKDKKVHVSVCDYTGKQVLDKTINTSNKGKVSVELKNVTAGKYIVNATFDGDKNYSANATSKKIEVIERQIVETAPEVTQTAETELSEPQDPNDWDGDGMPDIFYSESYDDEYGLVQYYDTRDGQRLTVYEDGGYILEDSEGYVDYGYL